uniref:Tachykinin-related peptide 6 n=1 Tax=Pyrrhocoris apterus TaxID=37000 RepID=TRP6_PYRAP|nr:RecName: Full=Tachykinin-related peptide 6; Short=TKRP-6 [Pyrrhocoris apterus]
APSSMGFMGMR